MIDPESAYRERLESRRAEVTELRRQLANLGRARLFTFAIAGLLAWLSLRSDVLSAWWLTIPAAAFAYLVVRYDNADRRRLRAERAARFHERGLARLEGDWSGHGTTGERFLNTPHLAALDLDLLGKGSLFERLCIARTRPGEDTLAAWLLDPADATEIASRQSAVIELRPNIDLRERIALLGAELPPLDLERLAKWGAAPPSLTDARLRRFVPLLAAANVLTLGLAFIAGVTVAPFLVAIFASTFVSLRHARRVDEVIAPVERAGADLTLLAGLLRTFESEPFAAEKLRQLQVELRAEDRSPSEQIADLARRIDWLNARKNQMFAPLALLLLWKTQMAIAFETWRGRSGPLIARWIRAVGTVEALGSIASYASENPSDPFPEVIDGPAVFDGEGLGHPLLPTASAVRNDVRLVAPTQLLLVSGSNMSGKSTLLRTVGTNAALALAGGPVRATRLRLSPLRLGATLRVQDSLLAGKSRFFAEITRVREILDAAKGPIPVLFLLDEIFHGTNSHDRVVGAEAVLRELLDAGAIGLVTTHDLTLTAAADRLAGRAVNVHFADQFIDGEMAFDYQMRPGVVPHSNALALMRAIGLGV